MSGRRKIKHPETSGRGIEVRFEDAPSSRKSSGTIDLSLASIVAFSLLLFVLGAAADRLLPSISPGPPSVRASTEDLPSVPLPSGAGLMNQGSPGANSSPPQPSQGPGPGVADSLAGPSGVSPQGPGSVGTPIPPPPPDPALFHKAAVRETIHKNFPLTPEDIRLLKRTLYETQKAVHGSPPVGRAVSLQVSLDPGASFPVVHLVPGIASTITVVDATGAPWPIEDVIVGNSKSFPVRRMSTSNGVVIEPKNNVGWTSLSLVMKGRGTPAVLKLVDSDHVSDTRVTARIEGRGPNAITPLFREPKPIVSSRILAFLDGIPPSEARSIPVHGTKDMEAWRFGSRLFVRTHMDVLAPAWNETVAGPNGMKLYVFSPVSVITAAGEDGEMVTVELGEGDADVQKR
ncbi:MAG: DotH/IcmK family type IV secretion protein [Leptospirales bacterium]